MKLATRAADETENQEAPTGVRVARAIQRLFDSHWATLLAAFAVSALIGLLLITMTGGDPVLAVRITIDSTIGTARGLIDTLVFTTPRLLVALGAIVALRAGIFNLGGEGQLQLGAVGAILGGYYLAQHLPVVLALPAAILLSFGVCRRLGDDRGRAQRLARRGHHDRDSAHELRRALLRAVPRAGTDAGRRQRVQPVGAHPAGGPAPDPRGRTSARGCDPRAGRGVPRLRPDVTVDARAELTPVSA